MALKFSKCQYPGICNSCSKKAEYYVQAGCNRLLLCHDCSRELRDLIRIDTEVIKIDEGGSNGNNTIQL